MQVKRRHPKPFPLTHFPARPTTHTPRARGTHAGEMGGNTSNLKKVMWAEAQRLRADRGKSRVQRAATEAAAEALAAGRGVAGAAAAAAAAATAEAAAAEAAAAAAAAAGEEGEEGSDDVDSDDEYIYRRGGAAAGGSEGETGLVLSEMLKYQLPEARAVQVDPGYPGGFRS